MHFTEKYKWLLPSLCFSSMLIVCRVFYSGQLTFLFLLWNLFLAALPLYFAHRVHLANSSRKGWLFAALWLLFFPNAMYITTDLFHLYKREYIPLWYDLLLILSAALNGVILGFISLQKMEQWLVGFIDKKFLSVVIFLTLVMCGYGIYLGRYERWNSWDIITNPLGLAGDIVKHVIHPFRNKDIWILSTAFGTWMFLIYQQLSRVTKSS